MKKGLLVVALLVCAAFLIGVADANAFSVVFKNKTGAAVQANLTFGSGSNWMNSNDQGMDKFCDKGKRDAAHCSFAVPPDPTGKKGVTLPDTKKIINFAMAFGSEVGCNPPSTKAEVNLNDPGKWDNVDVSLVDGFTNKIQINVLSEKGQLIKQLGPPAGPTGNQNIFGVFPRGCTVCDGDNNNQPCKKGYPTSECKPKNYKQTGNLCQYQVDYKNAIIEIVLVP